MKAILLASIMCFVLFIVPSLKYPSNPPAVGDPDTIYYRQGLFVTFLVISGASALGVTALIKKINQTVSKKVAIACTIYGAIMIVSYLAMPSNPDKISISMNLVEAFRLVSAATIVMFWEILGATFGTLWNRFNPNNLEKVTAF
jgi:predicted cobalt transporter CbtA